jgi:asparagine synthase (glutamine-hydrolysing)
MCGIFAIFLNRPLTDQDIDLGRAGTVALEHRGPDGSGEWVDRDAGVFLGHRRLAIIDPNARSDQPMQAHNGVLTYNGEIYNFQKLRQELKSKGRAFTTEGDTEVLSAAIDHWQEEAFNHFDGMFAFAFWDGHRAILAVDPFGEKPLFHVQTKDGVYLSSEIAPLAALLGLKPGFDDESLAAYISIGRVPSPKTAYPAIAKLPPASWCLVSSGRIGPVKRYWRAPIGEPGRGRVNKLTDKDLDEIGQALIASLESRVYADVPVSMFLSAGVDSSLIAALCARELDFRPQAITISFPNGNVFDEAPAARAIASELGLDHKVIDSHEDPENASPEALIDLLGQPADMISALSVQQIAQAVAQTHKVAMTGVGGDEIFSGYGKYEFAWRRRAILDLPVWLRRLFRNALGPISKISQKARQARQQYFLESHEQYLAIKNFPCIDQLRDLSSFSDWATATFPRRHRALYLDMKDYDLNSGLADEQLYSCDAAGMSKSIELRTPFLNRDLAEKIAEFDPRSFVAYGQKSVLRALLARYLPTRLTDIPKAGLIYPNDLFLQNVGNRMPSFPAVPDRFIENVWQRRYEGGGNSRLAVRLVIAAKFLSATS